MSQVLQIEGFNERFATFIEKLQELSDNYYRTQFPTLTPTKVETSIGGRYVKVIKSGNQKSVHTFIDRTNGDILKAATWRAPAKNGVRGNIFAEDFGMSCVDQYGAKYLRN